METIKLLLPYVQELSLLLTILSVGLQSQWTDFVHVLARPLLLLRGMIAVNIVVPAAGTILVLILPLETGVRAGIILMAVSPLAALVPTRMLKAGAAPSLAIGLYVALMLFAVVIVPATLFVLSVIFPADADIAPATVAKMVLLSVLGPLSAGTLVGTIAPRFAQRAAPVALMVGNISFLVVLVPVVIVSAPEILALFGNGTIVAIALTILSGLVAGHLLGGPEPGDRKALALAAATRHPGMAAMIARENFRHPVIEPALILFLLTGIVMAALYQAWLSRRAADERFKLRANGTTT